MEVAGGSFDVGRLLLFLKTKTKKKKKVKDHTHCSNTGQSPCNVANGNIKIRKRVRV